MPACTFTSRTFILFFMLIMGNVFVAQLLIAEPAHAQTEEGVPPADASPNSPPTATENTEDESKPSPYLNYGTPEFTTEEEQDTLFFQYGKFFGVGLGIGYQAFTGNRGNLYQPAFPRIDVRAQVWFDFHFAIVLNLSYAGHRFIYQGDPWNANFMGFGVDLKYYFDTRDASAAWTFANPFIIGGVENTSKTVSSVAALAPDLESAFGFNVGGGLEFPVAHKKSYVTIDGRLHFASYEDQYTNQFSQTVPNLSGFMYSLTVAFMFVW